MTLHDLTALNGSTAAMVTPFDEAGELDEPSLRALTRFQLAGGSHAVSIGGSTSEPSAMTVAERVEAMRIVVDEVDGRVPFMAGTGATRMDDTLRLTQAAADLGADACLVVTPYYARPTQQGLFEWYRHVADTFPTMPIILYNVPSRTSVDLAPGTIARLVTTCDNIVGVKETTKDFEHFSHVLHQAPSARVWSGIELLCLPVMALGGQGFISATTNIVPAAMAQMYAAWVTGDHAAARRLHYALHPIVEAIFVETNPAPLKWMLREHGIIASAHVRAPLVPLTDDGITRVARLLETVPADVLPALARS